MLVHFVASIMLFIWWIISIQAIRTKSDELDKSPTASAAFLLTFFCVPVIIAWLWS